MGSLSIWHWMIVLAVGLLLFGGRGKVSDLMGDVAKGIKSFKKGLADEDTAAAAQIRRADKEHRPSGRRRCRAARRGGEQGRAVDVLEAVAACVHGGRLGRATAG